MPNSNFRRIAAVVLIVAALAVWLGMAPDSGKYNDQISRALHDATANEATADSAPQQQVVNGWVARDLLAVIAREQSDADHRDAALLALLIVAIGVAVLTMDARRRPAPAPATPAGTVGPPPAAPHGPPAPATTATAASGSQP